MEDDLSHALGDPAETNLAAALHYSVVGSCPQISVGAGLRMQKTGGENLSSVVGNLRKPVGLTNRIMKK
jgi:hypothetical protein